MHGGDTRVVAWKVAGYLQDVVFNVTTKKVVSSKKGYDGIVGTSATQHPLTKRKSKAAGFRRYI